MQNSETPADLVALRPQEIALLTAIAEQPDPVGARLAARSLEQRGIKVSEASVSRLLTRLDSLGFTKPVGRKGRVLTPEAHVALSEREHQVKRNQSFSRALELRSPVEVLDWLRARRAIEGEAAYLAALRIDSEELQQLESEVAEHERAAQFGNLGFRSIGMNFHKMLVRAAQSPVFTALVDSLISEDAAAVESAIDLITANHGTIGVSANEHYELLEALKSHDPVASRRIMQEHMTRLATEVEMFVEESGDAAFVTAIELVSGLQSNQRNQGAATLAGRSG